MDTWTYEWDGDIEGIAVNDSGNVFVGSSDGMVRSFDPNGNVRWTYTTRSDVESVTCSTESGLTVYAGCADGSIHRIDPSSGDNVWVISAYSDPVMAITTDVTGGDAVYSASIGDVRKHAGDGTHQWTYRGHSADVEGLFVRENETFTGADDETATKLDSSGNEVWKYALDSEIENVCVGASGQIYYNSDGRWVSSRSSDGATQLWEFDEPTSSFESMTVAESPEGTITWNGDNDGVIWELDADGNKRWTTDLSDGRRRYQIASLTADSAGNIYAGSNKGEVFKITERAWGDGPDSEPKPDRSVEDALQSMGIDPSLTTAEMLTLAQGTLDES